MTGTQGIPDDLKPSDELPVDLAGALEMIYRRLCTIDDDVQVQLGQVRSVVLELREAVKQLS